MYDSLKLWLHVNRPDEVGVTQAGNLNRGTLFQQWPKEGQLQNPELWKWRRESSTNRTVTSNLVFVFDPDITVTADWVLNVKDQSIKLSKAGTMNSTRHMYDRQQWTFDLSTVNLHSTYVQLSTLTLKFTLKTTVIRRLCWRKSQPKKVSRAVSMGNVHSAVSLDFWSSLLKIDVWISRMCCHFVPSNLISDVIIKAGMFIKHVTSQHLSAYRWWRSNGHDGAIRAWSSKQDGMFCRNIHKTNRRLPHMEISPHFYVLRPACHI